MEYKELRFGKVTRVTETDQGGDNMATRPDISLPDLAATNFILYFYFKKSSLFRSGFQYDNALEAEIDLVVLHHKSLQVYK